MGRTCIESAGKSIRLHRFNSFLLLVLSAGMLGCGGFQCGAVPAKSPAGLRIKAFRDSNTKIVAATPDFLPMKFGPIQIEDVHGELDGDFYVVSVEWIKTGTEEEFNEAIWQQLQMKRPELDEEHIQSINLLLEYTTDKGEVWYYTTVNVSKESVSGKIIFEDKQQIAAFAGKGMPIAGKVKLESIIWQKPKLIAPLKETPPMGTVYQGDDQTTFIGGHPMPISFDLTKSTTKKGAIALNLSWKIDELHEDLEEILVRLLKHKVNLQNHTLQALYAELRYLNASGDLLPDPTEKIIVQLGNKEGVIMLKNVDPKSVVIVELEILHVVWNGHQEIIKME